MTSPLRRALHRRHPFRALSGPCPGISDHPIPPVETLWNNKRPSLKLSTIPPLDLFKITLLSVILTSEALMGLHQFFTNISGLFQFMNSIPDSKFFYLGHPP